MGITVATRALVHELQSLAERAEEDRVFADIVAGADSLNADLVVWPFADVPFAAVPDVLLTHRRLDDAGEVDRGPARRVLLEAVVPLDDLNVEALTLERLGRVPSELEEQVHDQTRVRRVEN